MELDKIIKENYNINVLKIEKNNDSTVGNVYIVYSIDKKYVIKIYDDYMHTESMTILHSNLSNNFYIPKVILTNKGKTYIEIKHNKYLVLYSFLEGIQIVDNKSSLTSKIALELRRMHDYTSENKYKLNELDFLSKYNLKRKSLLHFDLTKHNIFYNEEKDIVGFIDFDDSKYGFSVCDLTIVLVFLFFSTKKGVDIDNINLFIDTYYGEDLELKKEETKYIKEIALSFIDYILLNNEINEELIETFNQKKNLIKKYL